MLIIAGLLEPSGGKVYMAGSQVTSPQTDVGIVFSTSGAVRLRLMMEEQKTVLFVTHSIPEAVQLADRVVVMGPRPSVIERIIDIDLPRPRHRAVQESTRFLDYVREITDIFMVRGVLHD